MSDFERQVIVKVVPAEPGWAVGRLCACDDAGAPPCFDYDPVVAWHMEVTTSRHLNRGKPEVTWWITPITLRSTSNEVEIDVLRQPDGKFTTYGGYVFSTEAEALDRAAKTRELIEQVTTQRH